QRAGVFWTHLAPATLQSSGTAAPMSPRGRGPELALMRRRTQQSLRPPGETMRSSSLRTIALPGSRPALWALTAATLAIAPACGGDDSGKRDIVTESVRHQDVDTTIVGGELRVSAVDYVRGLGAEL